MKFHSLLEQFRYAASQWPDRIAITQGETKVSFGELEAKSNRMANQLSPELENAKHVPVILDYGIEMIVSILSLLKCGGVSVPITPSARPDEIQAMIGLVDAGLVITRTPWLNRITAEGTGRIKAMVLDTVPQDAIPASPIRIIPFDPNGAEEWNREKENPGSYSHITFTRDFSGSLQAVLGRHKSVQHSVDWAVGEFGMDGTFTVCSLTAPNEMFLQDTFAALASGATLAIPERSATESGSHRLKEWMEKEKITLAHLTRESFVQLMTEVCHSGDLPHLRYLLVSGGTLEGHMVKHFFERFAERIELFTLFGIPEVTLTKLYHRVQPADAERVSVPAGKPLPEAQAMILDRNMQICPPGSLGQLYIRTPYISAGYYNRPEASRKVFITNPFTGNPRDRIYQTGKTAMLLTGGDVEIIEWSGESGVTVEEGTGGNEATPWTEMKKEVAVALEEDLNIIDWKSALHGADCCETSSAQKRMFTLQQIDLQSTRYNMPGYFEVEGELDIAKVEEAFRILIARHETLRTSFETQGEQILQRIHANPPFSVEYIEHGQKPVEQVIGDFVRPFDLGRAPLLRVRVAHQTGDKYLLMYDLHHIVSDGTSMSILVSEFIQLYEGNTLKELPIQYRDYAIWQNRRAESGAIQAQKEYWLNMFKGEVPILNLPTDSPRPSIQSHRGDSLTFALDRELTEDLKRIAHETGSTLYMILLAAVQILLSRYSGQEDLIVGSPIAGRPHENLQNIIGVFINTLAIRNQPLRDKTFAEYLREVKAAALAAFENQEYPFEELVEQLHQNKSLPRDWSRNPLFDVLFVLQNAAREEVRLSDLQLRFGSQMNHTAKFDLSIVGSIRKTPTGEILTVDFEYCTDLFRHRTIQRMAVHFTNILRGIAAHPGSSLGDLEMLSAAEREQVLHTFNATGAELPKAKTITELFNAQAAKQPNHPALILNDRSMTYGELRTKANQLARTLRAHGAEPNQPVAVMAGRSFEMVTGILGIIMAGGAYLPIAPDSPEERTLYMLEDSGVEIILTQFHLKNRIPAEFSGRIIELDTPVVYHEDSSELEPVNDPDDLAYVIYTSGTTGRPKGTLIAQRSVQRLVTETNLLRIDATDRILQLSNYIFDASVLDIFGSLLNGASLILAPKETLLDFHKLAKLIREQRITQFLITTALFNAFIESLGGEIAEILRNVKVIRFGGERASVAHVQKALEYLGPERLVNMYGPTESTVVATFYPISDPEALNHGVPIGKPVSHTQIYVLNRDNQPQPVGVWGELCIAGEGLAGGYLHQEGQTAKKFVPNPFGPSDRMYRTGDLARWGEDGNLEFGGRLDKQVKIRGLRVELAEIEHRLLSDPGIREAAVVDYTDYTGNTYLAAYIVADGETDPAELRSHLSKTLPQYMIPGFFIQLPQLPVTTNGKLDLKALPVPDVNAGRETSVKPRNAIEEHLAVLWSEILGVETVGIYDNFFELGGHSLRASILAGRIRQELERDIPLSEFFKAPTIAGISEYIEHMEVTMTDDTSDGANGGVDDGTNSGNNAGFNVGANGGAKTGAKGGAMASANTNTTAKANPNTQTNASIPATADDGETTPEAVRTGEYQDYPTSSAQKRMYLLQQFDEFSTAYNIVGISYAEGQLDMERIHKAIEALLDRHETLRTSFAVIGESIIQRVHAHVEFTVEYKELDGQPLEDEIRAFIRAFDLSEAPLIRAGVLKIREERYLLMFDLHHSIADGTSMGILTREFATLYAGGELPPLQFQYRDYTEWQNNLIQSGQMKKLEEFWLNQFRDEIPVLDLPTDFPRPKLQSQEGSQIRFTIDAALTHELKRLAIKQGSTLYMVLLSGLYLLLSKYSGQEDIIIGSPTAGRTQAQLQNIIGMFVNTVVMRNRPAAGKTYGAFLEEVRDHSIQTFENQGYQFEELVEKLHLQRDSGRNPLFDVMFVLQNLEKSELLLPGLKIKPYEYESDNAKFDLTIAAGEIDDGLLFIWSYSTRLFKRETMERMTRHLQNILQTVAANANILIGEIDMVRKEEKNQILFQFNDTYTEYPRNKTIAALFAEQAEKTPERIAVVVEDAHLTYRELNRRANALAEILRAGGVVNDTFVGIIAERSLAMIVGVLAIIKAGGAYMPLDPEYPEERIRFMLEDGSVTLLLTQGDSGGQYAGQCRVIDITNPALYDKTVADLPVINSPHSLAYVIYTSGSTGQPKGVLIEHQSVIRLVRNTNYVEIHEGDKILQTGTLAFDASTFEIWGALLNGAEIHLRAKEIILQTQEMASYISRHGITAMFVTTALFNVMAEENPSMFAPLRQLYSGGEAASARHFNRIRLECPETKLHNIYGPTENTTFSLYYPVTQEYAGNIPLGYSISNSTAYIMDKDYHLCPIGVHGELCLGGDGLARGYLNRPELTAEKFIDNPWIPGERLYRTGDLARWLPDGTIEFAGRMDHQVKIRGFRVELGEIETRLLRHPAVKEVTVIDRTDPKGSKFLCAYYVAHGGLSPEELRADLAQQVPQYMIPTYFIPLEAMPLNRNGKIDRRALPEPAEETLVRNEFVAPRNEVETKMAAIWSDILGIEKIGIDDHFFELGGHSLRGTVLAGRIHKELDVEVPLSAIFKYPTIRGLCEYIANTVRSSYQAIDKAEEKEFYEASSAQKRMYALQQFDLESVRYNMPIILDVEGPLDIGRAEKACKEMIRRHETLRTSFDTVGDTIIQRVHSDIKFSIRRMEGIDSAAAISSFVEPFDLSQAPLLRVAVLKTAEERYTMMFDIHHIISDGTSMAILIDEFSTFYEGRNLPELKIQYRDYAEWQNRMIRNGQMREQEEYWLNRFRDEIPVLNLPTDYPRPTVQSTEGDLVGMTLDNDVAQKLKAVSAETGCTLYMILLLAVNILLAKYSGQDDIIVGCPIAGRDHPDLERIIGMFINTLAMRNLPAGDKTCRAFLEEVRENALRGFEHQDYQFEELVDKLHLRKNAGSTGRNPLFDVVCGMQNMEVSQLEIENLKFDREDFELKVAKFDLRVFGYENTAEDGGDQIGIVFEYAVKLFRRETIERMAVHLRNILRQLATEPDLPIRDVEIMTAAERHRIIHAFNETDREFPGHLTAHQIFEAQAAKTPDAPALVLEGERLTYRQLNEKANRLAHSLRARGVRRDHIVGLLVERSVEMMVGILGVLKAGGAYLPISPDYPADRIQYILEDSGSVLVLTQTKYMETAGQTAGVIDLEDAAAYAESVVNPEHMNEPADLAYTIYTSGSTGKPKGVVVEHRSLVNTITHLQRNYPLDAGDTVLQSTVYTFDASVRELFWWFFNGARLCLLAHDGEKNPHEIVEVISREQVTMVKFVPILLGEVFKAIEELGIDKVRSVKYLLVGGEALTRSLVKTYLELFGSDPSRRPRFINVYGPSEAAIHCTEYEVESLVENNYVPIGKPIANDRMYILDANQKPVPVGIPGELYISGVGLAREYLNNPALTAERFFANPLSAAGEGGSLTETGEGPEAAGMNNRLPAALTHQRVYRTGDLVRWLPDGNIEFMGRMDHQVKIRGYRIEMGEIETRLLSYPAIREVIVMDREDLMGMKYLCAYIVAEGEVNSKELREYLARHLPEFMIPAHFVPLDKLPLNKSGKIDRKALPEPAGQMPTGTEYIAPRNEMEEKLAAIWAEVLGLERVGITDNFFELGGHSLKATVLAGKIHKRLHVKLPLREIFKHPTIMALAQHMAGTEEERFASIPRVKEQAYYPVSAAQRRLYLQCLFEGVGLGYNMPGGVGLIGKVDPQRFEQTFRKLIERHETLRTSIIMINDEVVQKVHADVPFSIPFSEAREEEVTQRFTEFVRPFDLSKAPLMRVELLRIEEERYVMFFDMHHIISDGASMDIFIREFAALYDYKTLPPLRIQYKDFSTWQNNLLKTQAYKVQEEYWLEQFDGGRELPVLSLPADYTRPAIQSFRGSTYMIESDPELAAELRHLANTAGTTMYQLFLTAFNILLYKYTGQDDLIIGTPIVGRRHADLENVMGIFINMLAIRNRPQGCKAFTEFLAEVRDHTVQAYDHQDYSFEELVEKLNLTRDLSRNPVFDVVFSMQNERDTVGDSSLRDFKMEYWGLSNKVAKYDLTLDVIDLTGHFRFNFEYCVDLFKPATIEQFAVHYHQILKQIAKQPDTLLADIDMLTAEERNRLLFAFNATGMDYPHDRTLHELFAGQAAKTPGRPAVVDGATRLTYGELNGKANQLAQRLQQAGVTADTIVGIMAERSSDMIIGIFGVLKAGGAYMPIDPAYPAERILYMLEDSQTEILLCHRGYASRIEFAGQVIALDDEELYTGTAENPTATAEPGNLAYVMYTSGSTGKPKGVMIEHRGVVSLAATYRTMFRLDQERHILHMSNVSFDTSVVEIFPPLVYGSTVYIIEKEVALDRVKFSEYVNANQIHFAQFVPMTLQEILGQGEKLPSLESVIVGGDKLDDPVRDRILDLGYRLTNHYGPTESTVDALVAVCEKGRNTIGKPIGNTRIYILDRDGHPAPVGVPGELCIAGDGLARGYLNRPELTRERFTGHPFLEGERIYRTGDLACWEDDGQVTFLGRMDNQVKIRGYRIEPDEIAGQILRLEGITGAVVIDRTDRDGNKYLAAYYTSAAGQDVQELRAQLAKELPDYMIPSYLIPLERIPMTYNGKVDRRALPEPQGGLTTDTGYAGPTNPVEAKLIELWQEVLNVDGIGIDHNFFELGGHSLKAVTLGSKIQKELNVEIPFSEMFKNPTIRELAKYIGSMEQHRYVAIEPAAEQEYYPLSSAQQRLFIQWQLHQESKAYNMSTANILEGTLDRERFAAVMQELVNRHEVFRTSFVMVDGEPMQQIHRDVQIHIDYREGREEELKDEVAGFIHPFDLRVAPLLRVLLIRFAPDKYLLVIDMHHIISDGLSLSIFVEDFANLYVGNELQPLRIQYKDYAVWHNSLIESGELARLEEYWSTKLEGFRHTRLPRRSSAPSAGLPEGLVKEILLGRELTQRMNTFCTAHQMTKFAFLYGVFNVILARAVQQNDLTLGIPVAGRKSDELAAVIGVFLNVLVIRTKVEKEMTFVQYLREVRDNLTGALEHQDYPYESLYAKAKDRWNFRENSLFSILFNYMPAAEMKPIDFNELTVRNYPYREVEPKFEFTLYVTEGPDRMFLNAVYRNTYEEQLMNVIMESFPKVIETVLENEEILLKQITLVGDTDRTEYTEEFEMEFDNSDFF